VPDGDTLIDVAANLAQVRQRVARAAARAGREATTVRVVAVTKTQPVAAIEQVLAAGATDLGENYVQEAAAKHAHLDASARWHLIGQLQRNKAARALELFDVIHTVDSASLGAALGRHAQRLGRAVSVLIEVNVGSEATKSGVAVSEADALLAALGTQAGLRIEGLMTVPPPADTAEAVRPFFRMLRQLRERLAVGAPANAPLRELSMGMSDDFEVAIEEGATMVRIGRAIFGERQKAGC